MTRRVVRSEAELILAMRALKIRFGAAATFASISWPIRTNAISCSKIWAFSHIVDRSAIVYSASPESALTYCPGPTLREMTVPSIGAVIRVTRLIVPCLLEFQDFRIGAAKDAQTDAGGFERRVGRAHVVLGGGELRLGLLQFLERGSLALIEIADALLDDLRQIELGARLVSGGLGGDEFVLRRHLLGAVDFQQRIAALDLVADLGDQPGDPAGERRQNDRAGIFVERDLTDRRSLIQKRMGLDLDDLELVHLVGDNTDIIGPLRRAFGGRKRCRQRHGEQQRRPAMQIRGGSNRQRHEPMTSPNDDFFRIWR